MSLGGSQTSAKLLETPCRTSLKFSRGSPATSPELFSLWILSNPEVPEVSQTSPEVPPPNLLRGQTLSVGSLTPSEDSQEGPLSLNIFDNPCKKTCHRNMQSNEGSYGVKPFRFCKVKAECGIQSLTFMASKTPTFMPQEPILLGMGGWSFNILNCNN